MNLEMFVAREMIRRAEMPGTPVEEATPLEIAETLTEIEENEGILPLSPIAVGPWVVKPELVKPKKVLEKVGPERIAELVMRHPAPFLNRYVLWANENPQKAKHIQRWVLNESKPEILKPEAVRPKIARIRELLRARLGGAAQELVPVVELISAEQILTEIVQELNPEMVQEAVIPAEALEEIPELSVEPPLGDIE